MERPSLAGLPRAEVPEGYCLRHFRPGDEEDWNRLMDAAFERAPGTTDFAGSMAVDPVYRPERIKLVVSPQGRIAATASAWTHQSFGARRGMLHWVGTDPGHAGKKLGTAVSIAAMEHSRDEGRTAMALLTDDYRLAAQKTYLRLGFEPRCTHKSHPERWRRILAGLCWPQNFEQILQGPLVRLDDEGQAGEG